MNPATINSHWPLMCSFNTCHRCMSQAQTTWPAQWSFVFGQMVRQWKKTDRVHCRVTMILRPWQWVQATSHRCDNWHRICNHQPCQKWAKPLCQTQRATQTTEPSQEHSSIECRLQTPISIISMNDDWWMMSDGRLRINECVFVWQTLWTANRIG